MALPAIPLLGLGALLSATIGQFVRFMGRLVAGVLLQGIIGSLILLGISYYATVELGAGAWMIEKAGAMLQESGLLDNLGVTFSLGQIVQALRLVDSMLVIVNAYFIGLTINLLKKTMGLSRATPAA